MRTPPDIYEEYRIFRGLQMHQLRVAAVGKYIADRCREPVDTRLVVLAGLFHDMGNIIKARIDRPSPLYEPEGLDHWRAVKAAFHERYGDSEHDATREICRAIGLPEEVIAIIDAMGFSNLKRTVAAGSLELKVVEYADMRVAPFGVTSIAERQREGRERYKDRVPRTHAFRDPERYAYLLAQLHALEGQLTSLAGFRPADITDASVAPIIEELKAYPVA